MKKRFIPFLVLCASAVLISSCKEEEPVDNSPLAQVDFTNVQVTDNFWRPRMDVNVNVSIPHSIQKCYDDGRIDNFLFAAGTKKGEFQGNWGFNDSDLYKVLEGMAYTYNVNKDEALRQQMDTLISYIAAAQQPDGYLYTPYTLKARERKSKDFLYCTYDKDRYDNLVSSHEFYNMGHMYEAAVAHFIATGQRNFLDIAIKSANHIYDNFGPGKREAISGHEEIEIGLLKLYRVTGDQRYMDLAKVLMDRRGHGLQDASPYNQNGKPVTEQTEAYGHAVRANYLFTAMADYAALSGDSAYTAACDALWDNVVNKKYYITGGMGARYDGEAYGEDYELPNRAYSETCAAIAGVYWNERMFLIHGDAKYIDVLERTLYNGLISGISLDGTKFFYPNVLYADGKTECNRGNMGRAEWFDCSCCPTNDCRFTSSLPGYVYAKTDNSIYVNLYLTNTAEIKLGDEVVKLNQNTEYPWDGDITTTVSLDKQKKFFLNFRIPCWAEGHPVPGDLYSYVDSTAVAPVLKVNGKQVDYKIEKGYAKIYRNWNNGDEVELVLDMPVREVVANQNVEEDKGKVAIERGPIVYCFEEVDNGCHVDSLKLDPAAKFTVTYEKDLLGGINVLSADSLKAIPYCVWDNRGDDSMKVWIEE